MANTPDVKVKIEADDQVKKGLSTAQGSIESFAKTARTALAGVFAYFSAQAIGDFFKSAISHAVEAERSMADLSVAFRNTGADAATATPQVQKFADSLSDSTGFAKPEIISAISRLTLLTGDYHKAIAGIPTVLDVAVAKHIDLENAGLFVAKAMNGSAAALKRLGVVMQEGETPAEAIRRTFHGLAEEEGKGLEGSLKRLKNNFDEFMTSVGQALTQNNSYTSGTNVLIDALKSMKEWVDHNHEGISNFVLAVKDGIEGVVKLASVVVDMGNSFGDADPKVSGFTMQMRYLAVQMADFYRSTEQAGAWWEYQKKVWRGSSEEVKAAEEQYKKSTDEINARFEEAKSNALVPGLAEARSEKPSNKKTPPPPPPGSPFGDEANTKKTKSSDEIDDAKEKLAIDGLRQEGLSDLLAMETATLGIMNDENATEEQRIEAAKNYARIEAAINDDEKKQLDAANKAIDDRLKKEEQGLQFDDTRHASLVALREELIAQSKIAGDPSSSIEDRAKAFERLKAIQKDLGSVSVADQFKDAWSNAFDEIESGTDKFVALKGAVEESMVALATGGDIGNAFGKAVGKVVGAVAKIDGAYHIARGIATIAEGGWPPNPAALAAGGQEITAGQNLLKLAGQVGAGGGGASGAGGASPGSLNLSQQAASNSKPTGEVVIEGGPYLDMTNPRVADALENALGTMTDRRIIISLRP